MERELEWQRRREVCRVVVVEQTDGPVPDNSLVGKTRITIAETLQISPAQRNPSPFKPHRLIALS
jgi:hypothetical protein